MKKVLVTIPVENEHKQYLETVGKGLEFIYADRETLLPQLVKDAEIILGNVPPEYLKDAAKLKFLQLDSAGAVPYTAPGVMPKGAQLANATGAYGLAISEHMLGCVFMLRKKLDRYLDDMKRHEWKDEGPVLSIADSVTLVVGLGDIGGQFAQKMHALGSHVIGIRRHRSEAPDYLEELYTMEELDTLLPKTDIVACSLPGTPQTAGLFDAGRLDRMKKGAILLNVGRGSLIPSDALLEALKSGHLGGAAIDVAEEEPLPPESPLWDAPNLLITPHVSGNYHMRQILETVVKIAGENLSAFLEERPIRNEVDFQSGYRKFTGQ